MSSPLKNCILVRLIEQLIALNKYSIADFENTHATEQSQLDILTVPSILTSINIFSELHFMASQTF